MVLSDTSKGDIGWKKYLVAGWAFTECLLFGGLLYGWGSLVFVLKDEGVYANLCPSLETIANSSNLSVNYNVTSSNQSIGYVVLSTPSVNASNANDSVTEDLTVRKVRKDRCIPQDEKMALCFTIASAIFCAGCAVMGHINYKFGTRVTRISAL